MNYRGRILSPIAAFCAILTMTACSSSDRKTAPTNYNLILSSDSLPPTVKNVVKAVHDNDPTAFAREVGYPLERPYPLKDIRDAEGMTAYYSVIVDDSLRNVILSSAPDDWEQYGWRGYSLGDGSYLWIDGSVYSINYVSRREQQLIDSLNAVERNSLPKQLGTSWQPVLTLSSVDGGDIYRIDERIDGRKGPRYRLAVYDNHKNREDLLGVPSKALEGDLRVEGSATVISYVFRDAQGDEYVVYPDDPASGTPEIVLPDGSSRDLRKSYWHELIR